jgi:hypothetical protein
LEAVPGKSGSENLTANALPVKKNIDTLSKKLKNFDLAVQQ